MIKRALICDFKKRKLIDCIYSPTIIGGKYMRVRVLTDKGIGMNKGLTENASLYPVSDIIPVENRKEVEFFLKELEKAKETYDATKSYISKLIANKSVAEGK
jgi:hypothetical protein